MNRKELASLGGKATAVVSRKRALDRYYSNPNYCKHCGKLIEVLDGHPIHESKVKQFCSRSCFAIFNNNKRKKIRVKKEREYKEFDSTVSKQDLFNKAKSWQSARSMIRKHAYNVYIKSGRPLVCFICGYEKHIEICHIKPVSNFKTESISEINSEDNLIALCPNHHWEFDNNILQITI